MSKVHEISIKNHASSVKLFTPPVSQFIPIGIKPRAQLMPIGINTRCVNQKKSMLNDSLIRLYGIYGLIYEAKLYNPAPKLYKKIKTACCTATKCVIKYTKAVCCL